jgi:hypothetical protein
MIMKEVYKKANESARAAGGLVKLRMDGNGVVICGNSIGLGIAKDVLAALSEMLDAMVTMEPSEPSASSNSHFVAL